MIKPTLAAAFLAILTACASAQPNAVERVIYNVTTQRVDVVVLRTNISATATNIVAVPGIIEIPIYETKESVTAGVKSAGAVASTFGFGGGGIASSLVLSILGAYAAWRNSRNKKMAGSFAQSLEVGRETIKAVGGEAMERRFVEQIKGEQASAGVKTEASAVSAGTVNTVEARASAEDVVKPITEPVKP